MQTYINLAFFFDNILISSKLLYLTIYHCPMPVNKQGSVKGVLSSVPTHGFSSNFAY